MKLLLILATLASASPALASDSNALPRSTPEAQGIPSSAILDFVNAAEASIDALHSVMIVRHGHVVAEGWWQPYERNDPHELYSLSKSFTSTAVGLAIAEGRFSLDDTVVSFFPDQLPPDPSDNLKAMRVRDLLRMNTGHHAEDLQAFHFDGNDLPLTKAFLALPVAHKPGTHFLYNTPATYMLSAIVQKTTGQTVLDYLGPRLFGPLGMGSPTWNASPAGISFGGFGLSLTTADIARFGQLYLQQGEWHGRQLVPAAWVREATSLQTSNGSNPDSDWDQGYGYQFWRARHGLYRGDGAFGQFCIVMEKQDAVVAITSAVRDMAAVMNLVWKHVLPAMGDGPLPADAAAAGALADKLAHLSLPPAKGAPSSRIAKRVSGKRYTLPKNQDQIETVGLDTRGNATTLVLGLQGREWSLPVGRDGWTRGGTLPYQNGEQPVATTGAWSAPDTFAGRLCMYRTVHCTTFKLRFHEDHVHFDHEQNVAFGDPTRPPLIGTVEE